MCLLSHTFYIGGGGSCTSQVLPRLNALAHLDVGGSKVKSAKKTNTRRLIEAKVLWLVSGDDHYHINHMACDQRRRAY